VSYSEYPYLVWVLPSLLCSEYKTLFYRGYSDGGRGGTLNIYLHQQPSVRMNGVILPLTACAIMSWIITIMIIILIIYMI